MLCWRARQAAARVWRCSAPPSPGWPSREVREPHLLPLSLSHLSPPGEDVKAASAPCACVCHTHTDPPVPTPCQDGIKTEGSSVVQNGMETCNRESVRPSSAVDPVGREKGVADSKEKGVANPPIKSEMDEDFCKPKKRYRTPGGVANSVSCILWNVITIAMTTCRKARGCV